MTDESSASHTQEEQAVNPYARSATQFKDPPKGFWQSLKHLGPGMILVGSVVGSGELIMTTKLGAEAGFVLLWFVLVSCGIKVVVQAELARHTISSGRTFLDVFNSLPGPKGRRPVWLKLEWMAVVIISSVLAVAGYEFVEIPGMDATFVLIPMTLAAWIAAAYWIRSREQRIQKRNEASTTEKRPVLNWFLYLWLLTVLIMFVNGGAILGGAGQAVQIAFPDVFGDGGSKYWAAIVAVVAGVILVVGGYGTLERFSIVLVATFTLITIVCTVLLQGTQYTITMDDVQKGLQFDLPVPLVAAVVMTALGMYAGTGIGTSEMLSYTYWCVEKGYARDTGERTDDEQWPKRARGWIRVMYADVLITLVVYTVSTICFYFLGAAILNREGKNPEGLETLSVIEGLYTTTLGDSAATLFVVGAFFVLFSTVLSGVAGATRAMADGLCVMGIIDKNDYAARVRFFRIFAVISLILNAITYSLFENPPLMLMVSSIVSVMLYPVLGLGAIYLRHRGVDRRITPGKKTTAWLWFCGICLALISPLALLLAAALKWEWITI